MYKDDYAEKKAFVVYFDWETAFNDLQSDSQVGKLFRALLAYAIRGDEPDFGNDFAFLALFRMMANAIDKDTEKWVKKRQARIEAGKKGGRPKKESSDALEEQPTQATVEEPKDQDLKGRLFFTSDTSQLSDEAPPISDTVITDTMEKPPKPDRRKRYPFGEYGNVMLTMPKYDDLIKDFGKEKTSEYIRRADEYVQQRGKPYADYSATIRKWIREDLEKNKTAKAEKIEATKIEGQNSSLPPPEELERMLAEKVTKKDLAGAANTNKATKEK